MNDYDTMRMMTFGQKRAVDITISVTITSVFDEQTMSRETEQKVPLSLSLARLMSVNKIKFDGSFDVTFSPKENPIISSHLFLLKLPAR